MLMQLKDLLRERANKGIHWPSKDMIYFWSHTNFLGFKDLVVRKLGRKLLINPECLEIWLLEVSEQKEICMSARTKKAIDGKKK